VSIPYIHNPMSSQYSVTIPMTKIEVAKSKSKSKERTLTFHHTSVTSAGKVVNAMTGYSYPFHMGSREMFRCYMITTTIQPPKTRPRKRIDSKDESSNEKELIRLCYDSPDQYEEHTGHKASKETIKKWEILQHEIAGGCVRSNGKTYLFNKL
jgi:hypothetical protein